MEETDGMRGGSEGDIRSLFYWSRSAFVTLVISTGIWIALGAWRLIEGLTWLDRDRLTGSTQATSDITTGLALLVAAFATVLLTRWVYQDIVQIFAVRRYQVPREKLLVYGILAIPFGFVVSGVLLLLVNWKLSFPEFLPSHAEAYPETMPGFVQVPKAVLTTEVPVGAYDASVIPGEAPVELAPLGFDDVPVSDEEAQPALEFFGDAPEPAGPYEPLPQVVPEPAAPPPVPVEAYVEEVPGEISEEIPGEDIPEVLAVVAEPPAAPVVADFQEVEAYVEEAPVEAMFEAVVEEVPAEDEGDFELIEEVPPEELAEGPQTIEEAHEDLLDKLLGK